MEAIEKVDYLFIDYGKWQGRESLPQVPGTTG